MSVLPGNDNSSRRWSIALILIVLFAGSFFRTVWASDMEYKADEQWTYEHFAAYRDEGEVPMLGMVSSRGLRNPGMSIWVFLGLGTVGRADDPVELARTVQVLNIASFGLLLVLVFSGVPKSEREVWLWALALLAVNPLAVIWHRKIWAQSVLPAFAALFLIGWWYRRRFAGAWGWGFVGSILGQIHMPGFFFAAGFTLWAVLFDRRNIAWLGWLVGSVLGSLLMIPWLRYLVQNPAGLSAGSDRWLNMLQWGYPVYWFVESLGFGIYYNLGEDFWKFLRYPVLGGVPTFGGLIVHLALLALGLYLLGEAVRWYRRTRPSWRALFVGEGDPTLFTHNAALWGYGGMLLFSGFFVYPHYLIILVVLRFLWIPNLLLGDDERKRKRWLLAVLLVGQAVLTVLLLCYIHGADNIAGDYGRPYSRQ